MHDVSRTNPFSLAGRVAIVTGATGILGQHIVRGLAGSGADVAVVDLDQASCDTLAAQVTRESGRRVVGIAADLADRAQDRRIVERTAEALGTPDVLVNNAASKSSSLADFLSPEALFKAETWREVERINIEAVYFLAVTFAERLKAEKKTGAVVNISSIYGHMSPDVRIYEGSNYMGHPISSPAVYAATKAGVLGLTRYMAAHWAPAGIRVNSIAPGGVSSGQNSTFEDRYSARVPMGRMARAEEMVGPILFLASDAASYVTGQNLLVDGGLSAW